MEPDIPLITVRNSGFIGKMRLQYRQHCSEFFHPNFERSIGSKCPFVVVDTHAESAVTLRLDRPFRALTDYAKNLDMESMDSMEHSHVPYAVLLVRALERFKVGNETKALEIPLKFFDTSGCRACGSQLRQSGRIQRNIDV